MQTFYREALEKVGLWTCEYGTRITVFGFHGVHIAGHSGVLDFSPEKIVIKAQKKKICICGSKLYIREILPEEVFIAGNISGVTTDDVR